MGRGGGARVAVSHVGCQSGPLLTVVSSRVAVTCPCGPTVAATLGNEGSPVRLLSRVAGGMRGAATVGGKRLEGSRGGGRCSTAAPGVVSLALVPLGVRGW